MAKKTRKKKSNDSNQPKFRKDVEDGFMKFMEEIEDELKEQYEYLRSNPNINPTMHALLARVIARETRDFTEFKQKIAEIAGWMVKNKSVKRPKYIPVSGKRCTCGYKAIGVPNTSEGGAPVHYQYLCPVGIVLTYALGYISKPVYLAKAENIPENEPETIIIGRYAVTTKRKGILLVIGEGKKPYEDTVYL